ncbi:FliM/FliN family flagellar motor switch protein [Botrimarina hoheduenensis]|uniref:Flagellar motor switch protein FliN n=1 Tax=Botrimarina hoheduenensis TaxID=2528000 RepID=A0A5C5W9W8_9BACT|nr:FliM/FliN family flagellar motor switch protein [Botrimarina hoheduenensis]TWT47404.1 Flagellar motor switch protein FliN [Botrimarina hoheduenensis]
MSDLDASLAPQISAACGANAGDIAEAVGRALDAEVVAKPGTPADPAAVACSGAGLAVLMTFGERSLVATLSADSGLLPDWVAKPDPTGESKLSTLAQELSMLVVPDDLMADDFRASWLEDLPAAIERAQPAADAIALPIELAAGENLGTLRLLWPVTAGTELFAKSDAAQTEPPSQAEMPTPAAEARGTRAEQPATAHVLRGLPLPSDYRDLPPNVVSLLQINAPVWATLASKKVKVADIIEIGPGSILTFDKSCDSLIEISVAGQPVAEGEAVKVGERFGVRLRRMILPSERFRAMLPPKNERSA